MLNDHNHTNDSSSLEEDQQLIDDNFDYLFQATDCNNKRFLSALHQIKEKKLLEKILLCGNAQYNQCNLLHFVARYQSEESFIALIELIKKNELGYSV